MPLDRFTNLVWYYLTREGAPDEIKKFEAKLWRPPPGAVPAGPWSPEAETAAFATLKAQLEQ